MAQSTGWKSLTCTFPKASSTASRQPFGWPKPSMLTLMIFPRCRFQIITDILFILKGKLRTEQEENNIYCSSFVSFLGFSDFVILPTTCYSNEQPLLLEVGQESIISVIHPFFPIREYYYKNDYVTYTEGLANYILNSIHI